MGRPVAVCPWPWLLYFIWSASSSSGPRANGGVIIEAKIAPKSNTPPVAAHFGIHVAFLIYFGIKT